MLKLDVSPYLLKTGGKQFFIYYLPLTIVCLPHFQYNQRSNRSFFCKCTNNFSGILSIVKQPNSRVLFALKFVLICIVSFYNVNGCFSVNICSVVWWRTILPPMREPLVHYFRKEYDYFCDVIYLQHKPFLCFCQIMGNPSGTDVSCT